MKFYNWLQGFSKKDKYHWYEVRFIYKTKSGNKVFDFVNQVGFKNQSDILKSRLVKTTIDPLYSIPSARTLLCNGLLYTERVCYLGYFESVKS